MACEDCKCDNANVAGPYQVPDRDFQRFLRSEALNLAEKVVSDVAPTESTNSRVNRILETAKVFEAYLKGSMNDKES